jgi:TrmH family RNA methyltransferase
MLITSRANERVKAIRALRNRRDRDETGAFFIEGRLVLRAGIETGAVFEQVVVAPDRLDDEDERLALLLDEMNVPLLEVSGEVFDSLSYREEGQSLGAVVQQRWETLTDQTIGRRCWVALHDIQHPGNLGTVIRTCDAIGGDGVILSGQSTDPYHPVAVRGSLGAIFSQRIVRTTPRDFAQWARASDVTVVGTALEGSVDYRDADYTKPVVLLMGSERIGLSETQIGLCDTVVRVPMLGYVESLNLSIAAALGLYEVLRQQERPRAP